MLHWELLDRVFLAGFWEVCCHNQVVTLAVGWLFFEFLEEVVCKSGGQLTPIVRSHKMFPCLNFKLDF